MAAATITTTSTFPVPAGLPSPRSPTLSDAGMILPETDTLRSISPSPYIERPPSPPTLYTHSSRSAETIKLGSAPRSRRGPSPLVKSPPLSAKSSRSTLRNMPDSHTAAIVNRSAVRGGGGGGGGDALASSPTMQDNALGIYTPPESNGKYPRNGSNGSGSVQSDDLDNWPTFDSHPHLDDSGVVLEDEDEDGDEDEEKRDHFPSDDASVDEEMDNERWLNDKSDEDDDLYSSAALSRRAEMILANAKKRLNVMEGNLRGARESLVISPTFNTTRSASALSQQFITTRERDRRLYAGIGPIPPRTYPYRSTTLASSNSPGHSRGLSETSVPLPFSPSYLAKTAPNKRASSAMGVGSGPWSPDTHGHGRFPIRETRSFETMRDPRGTAWAQEDRDASLNSHSRGSRSPTTLETLPEDESPKLHRSSSTTSDLRGQMNDLKGRISSLKMRAKEDSLRRRSLQSLRTPSPFTAAEVWYTGSDAYKASGSPVAADAGVGYKSLPKAKRLNSDGSSNSSTPKVTPASEIPAGNLQTVKEVNQNGDQAMARDHKQYPVRHYDAAREQPLDQLGEEDKEEEEDTDDGDFVSVDGDDPDQAGESVYEDAVYEMPATERHEDRLDAFDYENFFLHSAMGTYSTDSRRSSISSGESVATTRPTTAVHIRTGSTNSARRVSYHQRNSSVDSVSTVATFATAAEEQESSDEENEQMDQFSQQLLPNQSSVTPRHTTQNGLTSPRSDSAIHMRQAHSSPTQTTPRGTSPDLVTGLQTSKIYSILLETPSREEPRLALNEEEKQLIYSLAATFQQVCASLQSTSGEQYARQELRRRLDQARRVLNGEDFDSQTF